MNNNTKKFIACALTLGALLTPGIACAEGWYAGAGAGTFQMDGVKSGSGTKFLFGYDFNEYVAVEGAYIKSAQLDIDVPAYVIPTTVEATMTTLGLKATYPIGNAGVFAHLGSGNWNASYSGAPALEKNSSGSSTVTGFGVEYAFTNNVVARVERESAEVDKETVNFTAVSLEYKFR